eukprot:gene57091-78228_t
MRLPLLWIGVLAGRIKASLAASTGVDSADDAVKYLLAGADVVMTTSALLRHGLSHMQVLNDGLKDWLGSRGLASPADIRGKLSHGRIANPEGYETGARGDAGDAAGWRALSRNSPSRLPCLTGIVVKSTENYFPACDVPQVSEAEVIAICAAYGDDRHRMLDILRAMQDRFRCISPQILTAVAQRTGLTRVAVEGVASFYSFLSLTPKGRVTIRLCDDIIDRFAGLSNV